MTKPIAFVTGYRDGYPVVKPVDGAAVLPVGMALYTHPAPDAQPWSESSHGVKAAMRVVPSGLAYGVGLGDSDKVFAAFVFRDDAETFCKLFNGEVALMAEPAKAECAGFDSPPSSSKMGEPVAWSVFDKRRQKHWYTNESIDTANYYAKEYSHREADGSPSMLVVPLYTHPPVTSDMRESQIESAAKKLAEVMDYPWDYMPEQGKTTMRKNAVAVIEAAIAKHGE